MRRTQEKFPILFLSYISIEKNEVINNRTLLKYNLFDVCYYTIKNYVFFYRSLSCSMERLVFVFSEFHRIPR
jgi:hypothetical protein